MRRLSPFPTSLRARLVSAVLLACLSGASRSSAQLTWGVGGAGGTGSWTTSGSNQDWWNGSTNVAWTSNGDAIFAGTSGTVTVSGASPVVNSMTFNTAGYVIQSDFLDAGSNGLTVTTNSDATISSTLSTGLGGLSSLVKDGSGTLTDSGTNFLDSVQVNAGQYLTSGNSSLFFSDVSLANAAGVMVTLGETANATTMGSLSGGGTTGGIVQPNATARTVTLTVNGSGNFGGVLQNNGSGILALTVSEGLGGTQTLTNANTYSGATSVVFGTLSLTGNGSLLNSPVTVDTAGTLVMDNSATANPNRVSSSSVFTLAGGAMQLIGNSSTAVDQQLGNLSIKGAASITVTQGSAATQLTFSGFTRNAHATLNIIGSEVFLPGPVNDSTGIVTPAITVGNDWASVGGDGSLTAYNNYASDISAASTSSNVKLTSSGTTSLNTASTRNSLNLQNSNASVGQVLDLGGQSLGLTSGGLLTSGAGTATIQNGSISTSASELIATVNNSLTISASILEANTATDFTKTGSGTLTLTGTNTYAGTTSIDQGTLVVSSDSNLGSGSTVEFGGGTLLAAGNFTSTKGFTTTSPEVGYINTGGYNVTFSGANSGGISKNGSGTLTLTNAATGNTFVNAGTLALPNAASGNATLVGGTLQAAGTLSSLTFNVNSTLDIGGAPATTLTTTSFAANGAGTQLTIDFGIGSSGKDLWSIGSSLNGVSLGTGEFSFAFQNLGGVTTGVPYQLMTFGTTVVAPSTTDFAIDPGSAAAGWAGTFSTTTTSASITFTATPEPDLAGLLVLGAGLTLGRRHRRRA